jgi:hypothetical protein
MKDLPVPLSTGEEEEEETEARVQAEQAAQATEEKFMLDCDVCHKWFHGECVGIKNVEETPEKW